MARPPIRYALLLVPATIVALDLLFFYLDDILDEGRSFLYLDAYGRGFPTWWTDFQQFWGNFETWTIAGLMTGLFAAFALGKPAISRDTSAWNASKPFIIATAGVVIVAFVLGMTSSFSGVPYSVVSILAAGRYPEYFPGNVLTLLAVATGWWVLLGWKAARKQPRLAYKHAFPGSMVFLGIALMAFHLVLVSAWTPDTVNDILPALLGLIGFLTVVLPLFSFFISLREGHLGMQVAVENVPPGAGREPFTGKQRARLKQTLAIILTMTAVLAAYMLVVNALRPLDTGIDIKSDFIPKNMITWVYAALLATTTFLGIQGRRDA